MDEKLKNSKNADLLRKSRNQEILERMKQGDPLNSFDSMGSWFPPRPVIEKDKDAVKSLYGKSVKVLKSKEEPKKVAKKLSQKTESDQEVISFDEARELKNQSENTSSVTHDAS